MIGIGLKDGLLSENLAHDRRVAEAKRLVLEALAEHQSRLTGIKPADERLKASYEQAIQKFNRLRGGALYYPYLGSGFGKGALVELADGSVKYDFITGIGVHCWGHGHPEMVAAALEAALSGTIMQGNLQQDVRSAALVQTLVEAAQEGGSRLEHCVLTTSGAMANENALKILMQKRWPASRVLAFEGCFAGRTVALSQITDKPGYRVGLPTTVAVDYVPFFDAQRPGESTQRALAALRRHVERYPGAHAAMCFELVQGEGGCHVGDRAFFVALMEELRTRRVPIMIDEVQTFGRTTRLFAFQHFGLGPYVDVVTIGKLSQVCATLFTDEMTPQPGLISQTFTGGTAGIQAARVIVEGLLRRGYFGPQGKIAQLHGHFAGRLQAIGERHPGVLSGPFGLGAMVAFTPFDGTPETAKRVAQALFEAGVIGFTAGAHPARVRFLIPVGAVTTEDIDAVCAIVEKTLVEMKGQGGPSGWC